MKTLSPRLAAQPLSQSPSLSSFDPALPEDGALVIAGVLRDQFNGLADMIEAVPTVTSAVVDAVNTLPAGDPAAVSVSVIGDVLHLTFSIPMGQSGPPGEVTTAALNAAIATTSSNSNAVVNLSELAEGTYNQAQMQNVINKVDELINALRR
jgi:hypothetical protein